MKVLKHLSFLSFCLLLFSGAARADQLKIKPLDLTNNGAWVGSIYQGQLDFETNPANQFLWGYCVEQNVYSNVGTWYNYLFIALSDYGKKSGGPSYGLIAADLIWKQYADGSVAKTEKVALQGDIWSAQSYTDYTLFFDVGLLESLFKIAVVPNQCNYGQDYIVYRPVPEPATLLFLGTGLIFLGAFSRRKMGK